MKGRDDDSAWADQDDAERLITRVDPDRERRSAGMEPPEQRRGGSAWAWVLLLVALGAAGYWLWQSLRKESAQEPARAAAATPLVLAAPAEHGKAETPPEDLPAAVTPPAPPSLAPGEAPERGPRGAGRDPAEGPSASLTRPIPPPPPPRPEPGGKDDPAPDRSIIGRIVPLGKVAVEVEDYWVEKEAPNDAAYAALSGYLGNNSGTAMTLPQVEVCLMDGEKREYKPFKTKQPANATLNPLMKVKGQWAFQVPAGAPMWCAVFKTKDGQAVQVGLTQRTPQNTQLVESEGYTATAAELAAFASPRAALQQQCAETRAKMEPLVDELEAGQKRLAKIEKRLKSADDAVDSAKAALEKSLAAVAATQARLKELEGGRSEFRHIARAQDAQVGRAEVALQRAEKDAVSAAETIKEKATQRGKVLAEAQEEIKRMKAIETKLETLRKILDGLEKKMAE